MTTWSKPGASEAGVLDELAASQKRRILLICCISLFMNYLDGTILNVALPVLQRVYHADEAALQWIVDSFLLVLTCLLILAGSLADRFGRRRLLLYGLVIFTVGSLGCALSQSVVQLVIARMITGVGGSMLVPTTLSIVRNTFTDRRDLARAIGIWSGVYGIASACGPLAGGILIDTAGWRSIFLVNIPVGIAGVFLGRKYIPESVAKQVRKVDVWGQILVVLMMGALVSAIIEAPNLGWNSPVTVTGFLLSGAVFIVFVAVELRRNEPLIELRFFAIRSFAGANLLAIVTFVLMSGFLFLNTIYLQQVRDLSALQAGLMTLPLMVAIAIVAPLSGRFLAKHGPIRPMSVSPFFAMVAFGMMIGAHAYSSFTYLLVAYVLLGISLGLVNPTITHTSVAAIPSAQAGVASAITSASRQIGSALGVAVLGSVAVTAMQARLDAKVPALHLSSSLDASAAHSGIGALTSSYDGATAAVHSIAVTSYVGSLHLAWMVCFALSLTWLVLARYTTSRSERTSLPTR